MNTDIASIVLSGFGKLLADPFVHDTVVVLSVYAGIVLIVSGILPARRVNRRIHDVLRKLKAEQGPELRDTLLTDAERPNRASGEERHVASRLKRQLEKLVERPSEADPAIRLVQFASSPAEEVSQANLPGASLNATADYIVRIGLFLTFTGIAVALAQALPDSAATGSDAVKSISEGTILSILGLTAAKFLISAAATAIALVLKMAGRSIRRSVARRYARLDESLIEKFGYVSDKLGTSEISAVMREVVNLVGQVKIFIDVTERQAEHLGEAVAGGLERAMSQINVRLEPQIAGAFQQAYLVEARRLARDLSAAHAENLQNNLAGIEQIVAKQTAKVGEHSKESTAALETIVTKMLDAFDRNTRVHEALLARQKAADAMTPGGSPSNDATAVRETIQPQEKKVAAR